MTSGAMSASSDGGNTILKAKKENGRDRRARLGGERSRQGGRAELLLNNRGVGATPRHYKSAVVKLRPVRKRRRPRTAREPTVTEIIQKSGFQAEKNSRLELVRAKNN